MARWVTRAEMASVPRVICMANSLLRPAATRPEALTGTNVVDAN